MKLDSKEFKRLKELQIKRKLTPNEKKELESLLAKKAAKEEDARVSFKPGNDFSWWNKIPELVRDSSNFKCNWIPGTAVAPGDIDEIGIGVVEVSLDANYGVSVTATDPLNTWARDLYLRMFQKYRPASGYSASDLGMAIIAAVEVVKVIAYYERIYGVINRYSKLNVNMPLVEAEALGVSSVALAYLQSHMSDFRYDLNVLIRKAQRLCVPKDLSILADSIALFGYEYADHESPRSQILVFTQNSYGVYDDTLLSSGGSIEFKATFKVDLFDFSADNMCKALETCLNPLLGSDSIQRIFADLVVWFGADAMLKFESMPEDYIIAPVKSDSILHEFHNLETLSTDYNVRRVTWADGRLSSADQVIVESNAYLYQVDDRLVSATAYITLPSGASATPQPLNVHGVAGFVNYTSGGAPFAIERGHALDTYMVNPEPDIIVEGSLFKFSVSRSAVSNTYNTLITTSGFFIPRSINVLSNTTPVTTATYYTCNAAGSGQAPAGALACMDWAPLMNTFVSTTKTIDRLYGEFDNIIHVSTPDLTRIHRTIILSGLHTDVAVINK